MAYLIKTFFLLSLFSILLTGCASANNSNSSENTPISENKLNHDGYIREYLKYEPTVLKKSKKMPLLIVLHGGGGTSKQIMHSTLRRFNELADTYKFYVVYPQGLEKSWNDGRHDLQNFASQNNIDDVGFVKALIQKLQSEHNIDEKKVFVTGISNGGFMSFRLGCELRNEISAIAPVTASITEDALRYCQGESNVSLVLFNGTDDPLVLYNGGYVKVFGRKRGKITSTQDTINKWLSMLGCSSLPNKQEFPDVENDGTTVTKFKYQTCENNNEVALYRINGGGQTWPGSKEHKRAFKRIVGNTSYDINACDEMWKFFSDLH